MSHPKTGRNKRWAKLHEKGYSVRDIAKLYGVHFTTVYKAIKALKKLSTEGLAKV